MVKIIIYIFINEETEVLQERGTMSIIYLLKVTDDGSRSETSTLSLQLTLCHLRISPGFIFILINQLNFKHWRIVDLKCCVSFRYTKKWFRLYLYLSIYLSIYLYVYIIFQILFPYRLLQNIEYSSLCWVLTNSRSLLVTYFICSSVYMWIQCPLWKVQISLGGLTHLTFISHSHHSINWRITLIFSVTQSLETKISVWDFKGHFCQCRPSRNGCVADELKGESETQGKGPSSMLLVTGGFWESGQQNVAETPTKREGEDKKEREKRAYQTCLPAWQYFSASAHSCWNILWYLKV